MKFKKICFSTQLSELYGRDNYQSHIEQNREYWWFFSNDDDVSYGWHKIKVTYIRSGCAFYVFTDSPEAPERFFPTSCFMASTLVLAEIDPTKDLENFGNDIEKKLYCFDTEHTIVQNWNNEKYVEINEHDSLYLTACILLKKVE